MSTLSNFSIRAVLAAAGALIEAASRAVLHEEPGCRSPLVFLSGPHPRSWRD